MTRKFDNEISNKIYTIEDLVRMLLNSTKLALNERALIDMNKSARIVQNIAGEHKAVYGITTGFGEKINVLINPREAEQLQYNLIRTHATGVGEPFNDLEVKAIMLCRLLSILKGKSGIRPKFAMGLYLFIKYDIIPYIPCQGSLGASGDLSPLAHLALALIGEGGGEIIASRNVLYNVVNVDRAINNLKLRILEEDHKYLDEFINDRPVLTYKEGLALINGTSGMNGIAMLCIIHAKKILHNSLIATAISLIALRASSKPFDSGGNYYKEHLEQKTIASIMRNLLANCIYIRDQDDIIRSLSSQLKHSTKSPEYKASVETDEYLQNAYSLRCIPQVLGMVLAILNDSHRMVEDEINSVSDNPLIIPGGSPDTYEIFHGAHFHGQFVANAMDNLKIALIQLAQLSERRVARLIDANYNDGLPDLLAPNNSGLNCALEGLQYTATSLLAEIKMLAHPASMQSIPSNLNNQDLVSMGLIAARYCFKVINMIHNIIAVELVAGSHAFYLRLSQDQLIDDLEVQDIEFEVQDIEFEEFVNPILAHHIKDILITFPIMKKDRIIYEEFNKLSEKYQQIPDDLHFIDELNNYFKEQ